MLHAARVAHCPGSLLVREPSALPSRDRRDNPAAGILPVRWRRTDVAQSGVRILRDGEVAEGHDADWFAALNDRQPTQRLLPHETDRVIHPVHGR